MAYEPYDLADIEENIRDQIDRLSDSGKWYRLFIAKDDKEEIVYQIHTSKYVFSVLEENVKKESAYVPVDVQGPNIRFDIRITRDTAIKIRETLEAKRKCRLMVCMKEAFNELEEL